MQFPNPCPLQRGLGGVVVGLWFAEALEIEKGTALVFLFFLQGMRV